jgi:hypothetical protein
VNAILEKIITEVNKREIANTTTKLKSSVGIKLTITLFINSVLVPVISKKIHSSIRYGIGMSFGNSLLQLLDELSYRCMTTWFCIAFVNPLTNIFSILNIISWIRRRIIIKQGKNCKLTQYDANRAFEPPKFGLPDKSAYNLLMLFYTVAYLPLFPIGILISIAGSIAHFFADRFLFARVFKKSKKMGTKLPLIFMQLSELAVFIYCVYTYLIS